MALTVGCDPEVFFHNGTEHVPAIGLVGGTKEEPRPVPFGAVQEDNVMAEFNITPASNADGFAHNVYMVLNTIEEIANANACMVSEYPSATFNKKYLKSEQAKTFGCDPDFDAWKLGEVRKVPRLRNSGVRCAGGHVHVGFLADDPEGLGFRLELVQTMDLFLGLWGVFHDRDRIRRKYYGQAGAFRPKPYGIEYRTLSNFWIMSNGTRHEVFVRTQAAVLFWQKHRSTDFYYTVLPKLGSKIRAAIKLGDVELAMTIINILKDKGYDIGL